MRTKLAVCGRLCLVGLTAPVVAHHAVGAELDEAKVVKLTGTVSKVEWTNPHARIYFDVAKPDGTRSPGTSIDGEKRVGPPGLDSQFRQDWRDGDG